MEGQIELFTVGATHPCQTVLQPCEVQLSIEVFFAIVARCDVTADLRRCAVFFTRALNGIGLTQW